MDFPDIGLGPAAFAAALAITLFAGFVKGVVGFAMPMVMISAFSSFLPPETALAGLILPTLITNLSQTFRNGGRAAMAAMRRYWRFLTATVVFIGISAQFVRLIPQEVFLLMLGLPITGFAVVQLMGRSLSIHLDHRNRAEWALGVIGGLYGGVSGVWGPPLQVYLLSINAPKVEIIRVQGVVFLVGALVLTGAHLRSGVLNMQTMPFSAVLILPAMAGLWLGYAVQDRLDAARFRRWTLIVLVVVGGNLIRRALG
ncbi:MAG: sulfite exporter TauE/SafE family protein [Paracoccaceae bacterium]|nr:sulfite exporter TauE/SafE family protein [Paracoccaceae bacterium]